MWFSFKVTYCDIFASKVSSPSYCLCGQFGGVSSLFSRVCSIAGSSFSSSLNLFVFC